MQKDKPHPVSARVARPNVEPDPPPGKPTRGVPSADSGSLGTKVRKTGSTLKDSRANIVNASSAKKWLTKEELLIDGEDVTPTSLAQALMWLAAGEKCTVDLLVDGIRAVALCLDGCGCGEVADTAVVEIKETAAIWTEEARKVIQTAVDGIVEVAKGKIEQSGKKSWADQLEMHDLDTDTSNVRGAPSYARVAAANPRSGKSSSPIDHDYAAREALKRRRVLIDGVEGVRSAAGGLSPKEIVQKANIALTAARIDTEGLGVELEVDPKAVAARVLENGGVVLELETEEAVAWVLDSVVRKSFESNFGGSAKLVDKSFQVVVCFLPVTLRDSLVDAIPKIEEDNSVASGTIVKCKWLKDPKNWNQNQRFAHAVFSVNEVIDACTFIQQGVIIAGQRFQVKKLEELPRRCFKCQRIGHLANKCVEIHEVCPLCAGAHAGDQCKSLPANHRCINCTKAKLPSNHAAWDRNCPAMAAEKKKRDARNPDSQYKYFPSKEEWTWAKKQGYGDDGGDMGVGNVASVPSRDPYVRQPDKGWAGMKETRSLGDVVGASEGWKTVRPSRAGAQGSDRQVQRDANPSQIATGSNITLSQLPSQVRSQRVQRSPSSNRSATRGRQSRLGDYWNETNSGQDARGETADIRQVADTLSDNIC